jgi:hypothetical protein
MGGNKKPPLGRLFRINIQFRTIRDENGFAIVLDFCFSKID